MSSIPSVPIDKLTSAERDALILRHLSHLETIMKATRAAEGEERKRRARVISPRLNAIAALME